MLIRGSSSVDSIVKMSTLYKEYRCKGYNPFDFTNKIFFPAWENNCKERYNAFLSDVISNYDDVDKRSQRDYHWIETEGGCLKTALRIDMDYHQSWCQPKLDTSYTSAKLHMSIFNLARFNVDDFRESSADFWSKQEERRALKLNSPSLPFYLLTIKIPKHMYELLLKGSNELVIDYSKYSDEDLIDVPSHFIVFDGQFSAITVAFPFVEENISNTIKRITFNPNVAPHDELIKFLGKLPILYSDETHRSILTLRGFLREMYGVYVDLRGFDLGSLAVTAGCKLDDYNLFSLSSVVIGNSFQTEDCRATSFARPESFRINIDNFLRKLHKITSVYDVLIGHILRTCFPDPVVVLTSFKLTQLQFISWFTEFIAEALKRAYVVSYQQAESECERDRLSMTRSLNEKDEKIIALAKLCIDVPALQYGGPRYLHHIRYLFWNQYHVIEDLIKSGEMASSVSKTPDVMTPLDYHYIMFGRHYRNDDDSGKPLKPGRYGLQPSPQCSNVMSTDSVFEDVCRLSSFDSRPYIHTHLEWGRLNPHLIGDLFDDMNRLSNHDLTVFWVTNPRVYTGLRNIIDKLYVNFKRVERLEFLLTRSRENVLQQQIAEEKKFANLHAQDNVEQADFLLQQHRVDLVNHHSSSDDPLPSGIHQAVFRQIPGKNTARNRIWNEKRKAKYKRASQRKCYPSYYFTRRSKRKAAMLNVLEDRTKSTAFSQTSQPKPSGNSQPGPSGGCQSGPSTSRQYGSSSGYQSGSSTSSNAGRNSAPSRLKRAANFDLRSLLPCKKEIQMWEDVLNY